MATRGSMGKRKKLAIWELFSGPSRALGFVTRWLDGSYVGVETRSKRKGGQRRGGIYRR
jgi:hypothetical protein